jgi:type I restriction-modification system DNA methylase subunit
VIPNAEYRRTATPQANKSRARFDVANFPFPGIMWHEKQDQEDKNEKIF